MALPRGDTAQQHGSGFQLSFDRQSVWASSGATNTPNHDPASHLSCCFAEEAVNTPLAGPLDQPLRPQPVAAVDDVCHCSVHAHHCCCGPACTQQEHDDDLVACCLCGVTAAQDLARHHSCTMHTAQLSVCLACDQEQAQPAWLGFKSSFLVRKADGLRHVQLCPQRRLVSPLGSWRCPPGMDTRPTTLIVLSSGVMASLTERPTRSDVAS